MTEDKNPVCTRRVPSYPGAWTYRNCSKKVTVNHNGTSYCTIHDPERIEKAWTKKRKREAENRKADLAIRAEELRKTSRYSSAVKLLKDAGGILRDACNTTERFWTEEMHGTNDEVASEIEAFLAEEPQ